MTGFLSLTLRNANMDTNEQSNFLNSISIDLHNSNNLFLCLTLTTSVHGNTRDLVIISNCQRSSLAAPFYLSSLLTLLLPIQQSYPHQSFTVHHSLYVLIILLTQVRVHSLSLKSLPSNFHQLIFLSYFPGKTPIWFKPNSVMFPHRQWNS